MESEKLHNKIEHYIPSVGTTVLVGCSQTGKTTAALQMIQNMDEVFEKKFEYLILAYGGPLPRYIVTIRF